MIDRALLTCNLETTDRIAELALRAKEQHPTLNIDLLSLNMDLAVCVNQDYINLGTLEKFPETDFIHDIFGILNHLNRETGELEGGFSPRSR